MIRLLLGTVVAYLGAANMAFTGDNAALGNGAFAVIGLLFMWFGFKAFFK